MRMLKSRSIIRKQQGQRGATMVEFSLTLLTVIFVLFLLFEFSLWIYCYNVMANAAKAGVRYAVVHGSGLSSSSQSGPAPGSGSASPGNSVCGTNVSDVVTEVNKWASFSIYKTTAMSITICYLDGTNAAPNRVQVKVSNPVTTFFSIFTTPPVTATAQGRIVI